MKTFYHLLLILATICACKEANMEWEDLIVNNSLDGWHIYQDDGTKKGWKVDNGILIFDSLSGLESGEPDASLLSNKKYLNFEIKFDWKIEKGGNSGFMWGVNEDKKYKYPYQTGPEIQIIDTGIYDNPETVLGGQVELNNVLRDVENKRYFVGSVYDISPPTNTSASNPAGSWNSYHIKIDHKNNFGSVILNDILVNRFPLSGKKWDSLVSRSKFSRSEEFEYLGSERWYGFGKYPKGYICLQDHPGKAYFRNIKIRELD